MGLVSINVIAISLSLIVITIVSYVLSNALFLLRFGGIFNRRLWFAIGLPVYLLVLIFLSSIFNKYNVFLKIIILSAIVYMVITGTLLIKKKLKQEKVNKVKTEIENHIIKPWIYKYGKSDFKYTINMYPAGKFIKGDVVLRIDQHNVPEEQFEDLRKNLKSKKVNLFFREQIIT